MLDNIQVAVLNKSTAVLDSDVEKVAAAMQKQVRQDFAPVWGIDATVTYYPKGQAPPPGTWWLTILDNSDQAGQLGVHDLTTDGFPLSKVFAKSDIDAKTSWTATCSHELLEMLVDPDINLTVLVQPKDGTPPQLYAYEICDACEDDQFCYKIDDVLVSDFVYPTWFETFRKKGSVQFDRQNKIDAPFALLKNGYIGVYDLTSGTGWSQQTGPGERSIVRARAAVGSRRERRRTARDLWLHSDASASHAVPVSVR